MVAHVDARVAERAVAGARPLHEPTRRTPGAASCETHTRTPVAHSTAREARQPLFVGVSASASASSSSPTTLEGYRAIDRGRPCDNSVSGHRAQSSSAAQSGRGRDRGSGRDNEQN